MKVKDRLRNQLVNISNKAKDKQIEIKQLKEKLKAKTEEINQKESESESK